MIYIDVKPNKEGGCCWLEVTMEPLYPPTNTTVPVWRQMMHSNIIVLHSSTITRWLTTSIRVPRIRNVFHNFIICLILNCYP